MKKLTKIRLVNWHYFENETIDISGSFLISGENASGKSTLLDAIQFVLTNNSRRFNPAANERSKRTLLGYVRCKTGEEGNEYYRKGGVIAYVALEFYEESKKKYFTIGVKLDSVDEESEVTQHWFLEEGPLEGLSFIVNNKPALNEEFQNNGQKVKFIPTSREVRARILQRMGHLDKEFFEMIPKSLAFKPMADVKSFITKFILAEKNIEVDHLRENIRSYREFQQLMVEVQQQIASLEKILNCRDELQKVHREMQVIDVLLKLSELQECRQKIERMTLKLTQDEQAVRMVESRLERECANRDRIDEQVRETDVAIRTNSTSQLLDKLKMEQRELEGAVNLASRGVEALTEQLWHVCTALKFLQDVPPELSQEHVMALREERTPLEARHATSLLLQKTLKQKQQQFLDEQSALSLTIRMKKERLQAVERELESLAKNQVVYPQPVRMLQKAIQTEFQLRKKEGTVRVLADLLEITEPKLRDCVESYLGDMRFALVVEPQHFDVAKEVYNRLKKQVDSVNLLDTRDYSDDTESVLEAHSLALALSSEHYLARIWIVQTLGSLVVVDRLEDIQANLRAITQTGFIYENQVLNRLNPELARKPFIGKQAIVRQLELMREEQAILQTECQTAEARRKEIQKGLERLDACQLSIIQENIQAPDAKVDAQKKLRQIELELNEIEKEPTYIELTIQMGELKKQLEESKRQIDQTEKEEARLNFAIEGGKRDLESKQEEASQREVLLEDAVNGHETLRADAIKLFDSNLRKKSAAEIAQNYAPRLKALMNQREKKNRELIEVQTKYKGGGLGTGEDVLVAYEEEYEHLVKQDLIRYEDKLRTSRSNCELEFRESFLTQLRENIQGARDVFDALNRSLKTIYYGNDRYKFHLTANPTKQSLYHMIMSDVNVGSDTLFTSIFEDKYQNEMDELFEKLMDSDSHGESVLREYIDYRNYLDYDIEINSKEGRKQYFSKTFREKSGGETQTPYYVAIAASFSQIYSSADAIRLILLDEAFDKMDDERIASMLAFFKSQKFQVILATPPAKVEIVGESVNTILMVHREGYSSIVESYSYDEI